MPKTIFLNPEQLFWRRVSNLEKAMNNATNWEFKALFKNKLMELMKIFLYGMMAEFYPK